jgi:hypothetical protein
MYNGSFCNAIENIDSSISELNNTYAVNKFLKNGVPVSRSQMKHRCVARLYRQEGNGTGTYLTPYTL